MTHIIMIRTLAAIVSFSTFAVAIGYWFKIDTAILSVILITAAVFVSAQLTARLIIGAQTASDDLLKDLAHKVSELDAHGVRHQVIINSISDISNDEIRRLLDVQKNINRT